MHLICSCDAILDFLLCAFKFDFINNI
jgi:hypothetical protein